MHSRARVALARKKRSGRRSKRHAIISVSPIIYTRWRPQLGETKKRFDDDSDGNDDGGNCNGGISSKTRALIVIIGRIEGNGTFDRPDILFTSRHRIPHARTKWEMKWQRWRRLEKRLFRAGCFTRVYLASIYSTFYLRLSPHSSLFLSCSFSLSLSLLHFLLFISTSLAILFPPPYCCSCHGWRINDVARRCDVPTPTASFFIGYLASSRPPFPINSLLLVTLVRGTSPAYRFIMPAMYVIRILLFQFAQNGHTREASSKNTHPSRVYEN